MTDSYGAGRSVDGDEPLVSIIIVNYNGLRFLDTCLKSIFQHYSFSFEILVVDNNSADGSREYLAEFWPEVRLIHSIENLGFGRGNNLGAKHASGRYLMLLNNDTEVLSNLEPILHYLEDSGETWIAGGRLRNPDGSVQPSVGYAHTPVRLVVSWMLPQSLTLFSTYRLMENRVAFYETDKPDVDWLSGAYMLIRRDKWEQLGGFDDDIFMYVEDVDLCRRARVAGGKVAYIAGGDICHFEGGGKKGLSGNALMATIDSYRLLLKKQYGSFRRDLVCGSLALVFCIRSFLYLLAGTIKRDDVTRSKAAFYRQGAVRLVLGGTG